MTVKRASYCVEPTECNHLKLQLLSAPQSFLWSVSFLFTRSLFGNSRWRGIDPDQTGH